MRGIGETLITMRYMVDSFVGRHWSAWEDYRDKYKAEHGYEKGRSLSLQSYVGSDLTIDMAYLAKDIEEKAAFTNEYWIRSQGMQCIRNEEDRTANDNVWSDVLGKFSVTKKGDGDIEFKWLQDEKCLVENTLLRDGKLYDTWF